MSTTEIQLNLKHTLTFARACQKLTGGLPNDVYAYTSHRLDNIERETKHLLVYLSNLEQAEQNPAPIKSPEEVRADHASYRLPSHPSLNFYALPH